MISNRSYSCLLGYGAISVHFIGNDPLPLCNPLPPFSSQAHNSLSLTLVLSYHTISCMCVVHWTMAMAFKEYTAMFVLLEL